MGLDDSSYEKSAMKVVGLDYEIQKDKSPFERRVKVIAGNEKPKF